METLATPRMGSRGTFGRGSGRVAGVLAERMVERLVFGRRSNWMVALTMELKATRVWQVPRNGALKVRSLDRHSMTQGKVHRVTSGKKHSDPTNSRNPSIRSTRRNRARTVLREMQIKVLGKILTRMALKKSPMCILT